MEIPARPGCAPQLRGRTQLWSLTHDRQTNKWIWELCGGIHNDLQYTWGQAFTRLCANRSLSYLPGAIYVEFENQANPNIAVTPPTVDPYDGLAYYQDLVGSATRDFLRIPLGALSPAIQVVPGYESHFSTGDGNRVVFFAQTSGNTGVHGKTFSHTANSKVFGASLVVTPVWSDWTQDLIFSRAYYASTDQAAKEASRQIGVSWELDCLVS